MHVSFHFKAASKANLGLFHLAAATSGWVASEPAGSVHSMWFYSEPNRDKETVEAASLAVCLYQLYERH